MIVIRALLGLGLYAFMIYGIARVQVWIEMKRPTWE